ncbi:MAG: hypothetical protein Q7T48_01745 [Cellvibrio sp.]|uniref:hypothetical protein n=1 Tax=Cellvibrio sp. TaxID=1965322 RepID=UPI0027269C40|nr:hypothetical protein [Cellvibrio sp.]
MLFLRIIIGCLLVVTLSGCANLVSPSRFHESSLAFAIWDVKQFHLRNVVDTKELEVIGHGAGSFRHYPMNVRLGNGVLLDVRGNDWMTQAAEVKPVTDLIDKAFLFYQLDALEIDVQIPPADHPLCKGLAEVCAFVMHDTPLWSDISEGDRAYQYLRQNTLDSVLNYVTSKGYHHNHAIYLDLKATKNCQSVSVENPAACTDYPQRLVPLLKKYLAMHSAKTAALEGDVEYRWLRLVSFAPMLLRTLYDALADMDLNTNKPYRDATSFGVIAGFANDGEFPFKACLAQSKGPVPEFDSAMKQYVASELWIDRLWFSTRGFENPVKHMSEVSAMRSALPNTSAKPLVFSVSVYDASRASYQSKLQGFNLPLVSIMVDVDTSPQR